MKLVFVSSKFKFCLFAFPFIFIRFSTYNSQSFHYELAFKQEKLWGSWIWNIQWSPFKIKQVRLLENNEQRPEFVIEFPDKLTTIPKKLVQVRLQGLGIKQKEIDKKPTKLQVNNCELAANKPFDLSKLNPN
jgi:hypothetical protein